MPCDRVVWRIDRAGSLDRLTKRVEPVGELASGEVRVDVKAIGLNFADIFACQGLYSATPKGSFIPGLEFAGVVADAGDRRAPFAIGDRVVGLTRFGAYATSVNVEPAYLRPIPPAWSFAEAAAHPAQGLTAWYGLVRLGAVERGHVVLVQSAAGGVGLSALSILAALGARAIAVVGHEAKRAWLLEHRGLSSEQVIVRRLDSLRSLGAGGRTFAAQLDRALAAAGAQGFDVVFDAVAGPFFRPAYDRLRPEGRMVVYGAADFMGRTARPNYARLALQYLARPRIDPLAMISENRSVMGFNLIWLWDHVAQLTDAWNRLCVLNPPPPFVGRSFPFDQAPAALRYLQSGQSIGKVVLELTAPR